MSKIENPKKIAGMLLVGVSLVACSDNEANTPPSRAALLPRETPTAHVISSIEERDTEVMTPTPSVTTTPTAIIRPRETTVYQAPQTSEKEGFLTNDEKIELGEHFQPSYELDLSKMYLTDLERKNLEQWRDLIEKMSEYYGWDANLSAAMMISESGGVNGLVNDQLDAAGLWGILANHNGSPSVEVLMDPFVNATWHYAKMVDLCKVQGDTLTNSLMRYGGWEKEIEPAIEYVNKTLIRAGYMDQNNELLVPNRCSAVGSVPTPPMKNDLDVDLP